MGKIVVSTSWDDGDVLDHRLVSLLDRYNLSGTFYYCKSTTGLDDSMIKDISLKYEIGAHTLTHPKLTDISNDRAVEEIRGSKRWLEDIIGKRVSVFNYPHGLYNNGVKKAVKNAGFIGARTTESFHFDLGRDPFSIPVTIQVFPCPVFPSKHYEYKFLIYRNWAYFKNIKRFRLPPSAFMSWSKLAMAAFDWAEQYGGVWHIWGHSWEIQKFRMWSDLEQVFQHVGNQPDCQYVTNAYLAKILTTRIQDIGTSFHC